MNETQTNTGGLELGRNLAYSLEDLLREGHEPPTNGPDPGPNAPRRPSPVALEISHVPVGDGEVSIDRLAVYGIVSGIITGGIKRSSDTPRLVMDSEELQERIAAAEKKAKELGYEVELDYETLSRIISVRKT